MKDCFDIIKDHTEFAELFAEARGDNAKMREVASKALENLHGDLNKLKATLGEKNFVVFNTNEMRDFCAVPVMFYTNYCAYDFIPNEKQLADIQKKGVSIAILDNGKLPSYILNQKDIIKIGLIPN